MEKIVKKCSKCKQEKLLNEFRNDKHTSTGKTCRCKECLSTYNPKEIRCYFCKKWFIRKQSNWKFCTRKCHRGYWSRVWRLSPRGSIYMKDYWRNYQRK